MKIKRIWPKKEARNEIEKRRKSALVRRMERVLKREEDVNKKLEVVGETAKKYFGVEYGFPRDLEYGELIEKFEKKKKKSEAEFCRRVFELYYFDKELTEKGIEELVAMLVGISRKRKVSRGVSKASGSWKKTSVILRKKKIVLMSKLGKHVSSLREKSGRRARSAAKKNERLSNWVKRAILMGHSKESVSNLIKDGRRGRWEVRKILKLYDKEFPKASRQRRDLQYHKKGPAERIVQREKYLLERRELSV